MTLEIRLMSSEDWSETADLIYDSLNCWYLKNRGFRLCTGPKRAMLLFPKIYEALDPNCCALAIDSNSGDIAASCFFHPRSTHFALGIMNVHPNYFGQGAASLIMKYIVGLADEKNLPLRLVSSAMNLESFCLYNKFGFRPVLFFQDMTVTVPTEGFPVELPPGYAIRPAELSDVAAITALEKELCSIERAKDFEFFIRNAAGIWRMNVLYQESTGQIDGFTAGVCDPGSNMIGPGVTRTEEGAAALIRFSLNQVAGTSPVFLIPSDCLTLRESMFQIGARLCELHIAQVRGEYSPVKGIVLPSFMPETF